MLIWYTRRLFGSDPTSVNDVRKNWCVDAVSQIKGTVVEAAVACNLEILVGLACASPSQH